MTSIYFVRHAQPDSSWNDDRSRPLTEQGLEDSKLVTKVLKDVIIDAFVSSPYRRSYDTIAHCAMSRNMQIKTDEHFVERHVGKNGFEYARRRFDDFEFAEPGGESLGSVQRRNIEGLARVLDEYADQTIVLGTHGSALSTILKYYDPTFSWNDFTRMFPFLPYVIRLDFNHQEYIGKMEILAFERGYINNQRL